MSRIPPLLLILALPALADMEYADAGGAQPLPEQALRDAFRIDVEDGGYLLLAERESVTLAQLEERLGRARAVYDRRDGGAGAVPSKLPVLLHVDRRAPWWHVQLVLAVAARAGCPNVRFAVGPGGARFLDASLPMAREPAVASRTEVSCYLSVVATELSARVWPDGGEVTQPSAVALRLRGSVQPLDARTARELADQVAAAATGAGAVCRGVMTAEPSTPFGFVVEAMSVFAGGRFASIEFAAPDAADRAPEGRRLPFPERDRSRAGEVGIIDGSVRPPLAPIGTGWRPLDEQGALIVNLTRHGQIRTGGSERSLSGLLLFLGDVRNGADTPQRRVVLRVDGAAPWQHVAHLLTALDRRGIETVEFAVRRRADAGDEARDALLFGVPREDGVTEPGADERLVPVRLLRREAPVDGAVVRIGAAALRRNRLELSAEREVESTFGPEGRAAPAMRPLVVRMRWNGRTTCSFPQLQLWIKGEQAERVGNGAFWAGSRQRVIAAIGEKVPARYAIAALASFAAIGWQEIYFFEPLEQEDATLLGAMAMPYPATNRLLRGDDGLADR